MAQLNFDATTVSPADTYSPLPAGTYLAHVTESEVKPTKAGTGQILALTWTVLDGQYNGRKVFDRINVANQNKQAEEIGQRALSQLCHAVNVLKLSDSNQLHGKPINIKVVIRQSEGYDPQNEIKAYSADPNFKVLVPVPGATQSATPPWARK